MASGAGEPGGAGGGSAGPVLRVGLDLGTTMVKAAAFDNGGVRVSGSRVPMPPLVARGREAWQETGPILEAAAAALEALHLPPGSVALVALTGQRDTSLLVDRAGRPLTPLLSWRDTRAEGHPSIWDVLLTEDPTLRQSARGGRSLTSWLAGTWTGHPAESEATLPVSLQGESRERLSVLLSGVAEAPPAGLVPPLSPIGAPVGRLGPELPAPFRGVPLHIAAGDKNCEYLAMGIAGPGRGGISLGSAISFGVLSPHRGEGPPSVPRGVVRTGAAATGRWNLETGLVGGMDGRNWLEAMLGIRDPSTPPVDGAPHLRVDDLRGSAVWVDDVWCLPHFAGALDHAGASATLVGLRDGVTSAHILQAWMQGVAAELRRLRPLLEEAGGVTLSRVAVGGGGAGGPEGARWGPLLARALDLPVEVVDDPWTGCRGAVMTTLPEDLWAHAGGRWTAPSSGHHPPEGDHPSREQAARYFTRYDALVDGLAGARRVSP